MTFRELRDLLNGLSDEQLDAKAVYFDGNIGETLDITGLSKNASFDYDHDDNSQPILQIEQ